jgi:hypothetical protein
MKKLKDRYIAGVIAGMGANLVKMSVEHTLQFFGLNKETGIMKAAGFFLSPSKVKTPKGKLIGLIGDFTVSGCLGVFTSYLLTLTGKDYYLLKGLSMGNMSWSFMHGVLTQLGATKVKSNDPNSQISSMIAHTLFGVTSSYLLVKIADPELFFEPHHGLPGENLQNDVTENNEYPRIKL